MECVMSAVILLVGGMAVSILPWREEELEKSEEGFKALWEIVSRIFRK